MIDGIRFIWDPAKAEANRRSHGISFETAIQVFADPFHASEQDWIEGGEYRWQTVGIVEGFTMLLVAHTWRDEDGIEVIRLISLNGMKESAMDSKIVTYEFDPTNPLPLTDAQREELARLAAMPDEDIDFSDIPPLTEDFWKNAVRGKFYRPVKQQVTLRIDSDLIHWFKTQSGGERGY